MPKCFCGRGSAPDPAGGAYSAPQTPSWIKGGLLLRGGEGRGKEGEGREGERRRGKGRGGERRGGEGKGDVAPPPRFSNSWIRPWPDSVDDALEVSEVLNRIVDSTEAEISAIALALEASVEHFRNFAHLHKVKHIFILTDCKPALAYIVQRSQSNDYHSVLARVRVHLHTLHVQHGHSGFSSMDSRSQRSTRQDC